MPFQGQDATRPEARSASSPIAAAVALMRPKQWVKNGFVLVPVFFS